MVAFSAPAFGQTGWAIEREIPLGNVSGRIDHLAIDHRRRIPLRRRALGTGNRSNIGAAGAIGRQSAKDKAAAFASNVMPVVTSVQAAGVTTLAGIADALNGRGVRTARGGRWHVSTVMNLLRRSAAS